MLPTPDQLLSHMLGAGYRPQKRKGLAKALNVPEADYPEFRALVDTLQREGRIVRVKGNRWDVPTRQGAVVGRLTVNGGKRAFGLVAPEQEGKDIYVSPLDLGVAMHGDKVLVRVLGTRKEAKHHRGRIAPPPPFPDLPQGRIERVVERRTTRVVGTYARDKRLGLVEPDDPRIPAVVRVEPGREANAQPGQKVVVRIEEWGVHRLSPQGSVIEVLGDPDARGVDILAVARSFGLPDGFPDDVLAEAQAIPQDIPPDEIARRKDLRDLLCITIDPLDAKDYDDAVSLGFSGNGHYLLGVHIADVSYYVPAGSALDQEAAARGTSVYLVDRVIPMLPPQLSSGVCTLSPHVDRLAASVLMELDPLGNVVRYEIAETVINSRARLTYEQVQEVLDDGTGPDDPDIQALREPLLAMRGLSQLLTQRRIKRGAMDFDLPEPKVVLDPVTGAPVDLYPAKRLQSHRLIEEFMLLANETVAGHLDQAGAPFLYRVHDEPDRDKIKAFWASAETWGYAFKTKGNLRPETLQTFLKQTRGKPEEYLLNDLLLRAMKRAVYTPRNIGHFGLAAPVYTHFTSPIRRYPDLLVRRAVKEWRNGPPSDAHKARLLEALPAAGNAASERERVADEAERASVKVKQVQFMASRIGEAYRAIICGVHGFGFFVQLDRLLVEGLVHVASLGDDYYHFDEAKSALIGERGHRTFRPGDPVRVQVVRADPVTRQVDFVLLEHAGRPSDPPRGAKPRHKPRRTRPRTGSSRGARGH